MQVPFEQIQQALGAAIRGEEVHPVVSQRTLFGIPSSVEVQMAKFAAQLAQEQERARKETSEPARKEEHDESPSSEADDEGAQSAPGRTMLLRALVMQAAIDLGDLAMVGRGMRYFIFAGRNAGFDIPAYPFDPKGEFRDFLREAKAKNLPEWYESIGIPHEKYEQLQTHALLVIGNPETEEKTAYLLKGAQFCDASKFEPLSQSRILSLCDEKCLESIASALGVQIPSEESLEDQTEMPGDGNEKEPAQGELSGASED